MAILNYTTSIPAEKTIGEITKCLVSHGATKIVADYKDGLPCAVTFCLIIDDKMIAYALPANYEGVLNSMKRDKKVPSRLCTKEQALKVSWRIVKDWVEAQMAIVEARLAEAAEVFLPYAIHKDGSTLYNHIKSNGMLMLSQ